MFFLWKSFHTYQAIYDFSRKQIESIEFLDQQKYVCCENRNVKATDSGKRWSPASITVVGLHQERWPPIRIPMDPINHHHILKHKPLYLYRLYYTTTPFKYFNSGVSISETLWDVILIEVWSYYMVHLSATSLAKPGLRKWRSCCELNNFTTWQIHLGNDMWHDLDDQKWFIEYQLTKPCHTCNSNALILYKHGSLYFIAPNTKRCKKKTPARNLIDGPRNYSVSYWALICINVNPESMGYHRPLNPF